MLRVPGRVLGMLLTIAVAAGLVLAPPLAGLGTAAAAKKKAKKQDPRAKFRAGRAPKKIKREPIKPPPPPPPIKPRGLFRTLAKSGAEWTYAVRVDGLAVTDLPRISLRVVERITLGKKDVLELVLFADDAPIESSAERPPALAGVPGRFRFVVSETAKVHELIMLAEGAALPRKTKELDKLIKKVRPALTDPPHPWPDVWKAGQYSGSQERRVDFPGGTALASCYRWGQAGGDGTIDGNELCHDLEFGPVLLARRANGRVIELLLAPSPDAEVAGIPPPPSER